MSVRGSCRLIRSTVDGDLFTNTQFGFLNDLLQHGTWLKCTYHGVSWFSSQGMLYARGLP